MQIATLNYQYKPKEKVNGDSRPKLCHRYIRTTVTNPNKKIKQRQSLFSDMTIPSNGQLPPIARNGPRRSSIRIQGSSLPSSKLGEASTLSFQHQSRSHSRQSNKSDNVDGRSRSITPAGPIRPASKLVRLRFGYPVKLRSPDFYVPDKSEAELHLREDSFINDSIRSANQNRRSSIIPHYEALDDPHLRRFFQSPVVLDIVRKTLNADPNNSSRQDERSSTIKNRSKSNELDENRNDDDYLRIVTKGSSGYAKLNGYDCIPTYAPARNYPLRLGSTDPIMSSSQRWNTTESRLNHSTTYDKNQRSANTSMTSFATNNSQQLPKQQKKKKIRQDEKGKPMKPIRSSSPTMEIIEPSSTISQD